MVETVAAAVGRAVVLADADVVEVERVGGDAEGTGEGEGDEVEEAGAVGEAGAEEEGVSYTLGNLVPTWHLVWSAL